MSGGASAGRRIALDCFNSYSNERFNYLGGRVMEKVVNPLTELT